MSEWNSYNQTFWSHITPEKIKAYLDDGYDVNARAYGYSHTPEGWSPLHGAALWCNNLESINFLLDEGANINARAKNGQTPLSLVATWRDSAEIITTLLKKNADPNTRNDEGETPFHLIAKKETIHLSEISMSEIIMLFLESGGNIMARDKNGKTPLDYGLNNPKIKNTDAYWALHDARLDLKDEEYYTKLILSHPTPDQT